MGGPANTSETKPIKDRANQILAEKLPAVKRVALRDALCASTTHRHDYISTYVNDLSSVIDMDAVRGAGLKLWAVPLGGAGVAYWPRIAERYRTPLDIRHAGVDPTFPLMLTAW